jgi:hypothetical protein
MSASELPRPSAERLCWALIGRKRGNIAKSALRPEAAAASSDCVLTGERAADPTARMNNGEIEQAVERD